MSALYDFLARLSGAIFVQRGLQLLLVQRDMACEGHSWRDEQEDRRNPRFFFFYMIIERKDIL